MGLIDNNNLFRQNPLVDNNPDLEIGVASSEPDVVKSVVEKKNNELDKADKETDKKIDKNEELTKKGSKRDWVTIVVATSAVALGVIGLIAACFLFASIFTGGVTLLGIVVPLSIALIGVTGSILTLTMLKKITTVLDNALTKLIDYFKKKPHSPKNTQVAIE